MSNNRESIPDKPTGSDHESRFMQWVHGICARVFMDTPTVRFEVREGSIRAHAKPSRGGSGSSLETEFRGEYVSTALYSRGDEVWVLSGANTGSYIYVNASPSSGHAPWLGGGYWVNRPGPSELGQWM
jgi:hypothetical protein